MNINVVKLLQAAAECIGGQKRLALRLGISPSLLGKFMSGLHHVPDPLLLQAMNIVLAHHELAISVADTRTSGPGGESAISQ
jgi:DNA-binding transcriptional regulator YdaS (Cro superfamily)